MFRMTIVSLAIALTATVAYAAATDDSATLPERQAGLWQLNTSMDEGRGATEQSMTMCIDVEMERNTVRHSLDHHRKQCATYKISKADGQTTVDADCVFNERHVSSRTVMSGDFKADFSVVIESTTSDSNVSTGQSITVKRTIKQTGKYLGASCGALKPGEAKAEGGDPVYVQ